MVDGFFKKLDTEIRHDRISIIKRQLTYIGKPRHDDQSRLSLAASRYEITRLNDTFRMTIAEM